MDLLRLVGCDGLGTVPERGPRWRFVPRTLAGLTTLLAVLLLPLQVSAQSRHVIVPSPDGDLLGSGVIGLRVLNQTLFYDREIEVDWTDFSARDLYFEINLAAGLLPEGSVDWLQDLVLHLDGLVGIDFPNTPMTRFGFAATLPLPGPTKLGLGLFTTPVAFDHNATWMTAVVGDHIADWGLSWTVGGAFGYQAGGEATLFGAALLAATWEAITDLFVSLEYTGRFVEGVASVAVAYRFVDSLDLYVNSPWNLVFTDSEEHLPGVGLGLVWHY